MIGRFVNVHINSEYLTICELEVYGELVTPSPSFGAVVMGRKVVVVEKKLSWSDAVLYCRDFYWDLLSIRSEEEQVEVGEVLSTASFPLTKHVWLGLRRYLMDGTWFWMSGPSVDYSSWETDHIWRVTSPCGGIDTSGHFHWNDLPCGDHLHFICLTGEDFLKYTYINTAGFYLILISIYIIFMEVYFLMLHFPLITTLSGHSFLFFYGFKSMQQNQRYCLFYPERSVSS
ncbi:C-type lectin mannose-binding isoform [Liparis tanakae]|uniref:C-type lectin mannose-binding isoform n=1 Tax=Liparis tanakae TaxID=230148 RepID=A0A4Z2ELR0_9TELE|nr:C-type lectin mannose-binding isoform [Liparis tanakae]